MPIYEEFAALETAGWTSGDMAEAYVRLFAQAPDMAVPVVVSKLSKGQRVLDLCCGQGNGSAAALAAGCQVTGLDFSPDMLVHAQARVPNGEFVVGDAQDLPFEDASFDAVICGFGLMHIPDQLRALNEVRRVLRPGARFIMTSWYGPDVSPVFDVLYSSVRNFGSPDIKLPDSPDFHIYAHEDGARGQFEDAGLIFVGLEKVECFLTLSDPTQLAEIFQNGTPRAGYLLANQPAENLHAIKEAIAREARARFAEGPYWKAPMPAALAVAERP